MQSGMRRGNARESFGLSKFKDGQENGSREQLPKGGSDSSR